MFRMHDRDRADHERATWMRDRATAWYHTYTCICKHTAIDRESVATSLQNTAYFTHVHHTGPVRPCVESVGLI